MYTSGSEIFKSAERGVESPLSLKVQRVGEKPDEEEKKSSDERISLI